MTFRPPVWATVVTLLAVLLFGQLAQWQYQRGQEKADMIARRSDISESGLHVVRAGDALPDHGQRIQVHGYWQGEQQILLDNQTRQRQIGVHVWTPLRLVDSDRLLLVDRGWLQASPYRDQLPETGTLPGEAVTLSGLWRDLPRAGLAGAAPDCGSDQEWPLRLNYPDHAGLSCLYDRPLADGLLLLDPQLPDGFLREWGDLGIPPERHYGYAVQWAALLLTTLVLYVVLNLKRKSQ